MTSPHTGTHRVPAGRSGRPPLATRLLLRLREGNWRSAVVSAALVGTMVISIVAAWGVHASWKEQQRVVELTLREYARYAARTFAEGIFAEGQRVRLRAAAPAMGTIARGPGDALSLERYAEAARIALVELGYGEDSLRGFFRIGADGRYEGLEFAADTTVERLVREAVERLRPRVSRESEPAMFNAEVYDEPVNINWARQLTAANEPVATFGHVVSRTRGFRLAASHVLQTVPLIPSVFMAGQLRKGLDPMDSDTLVSIRVLDRQGREIYRSPSQFESGITDQFGYTTSPGGFTVQATLHPGLVAQIRELYLRDHQLRLRLLLPILSILLAAAAVVHMRRDQELSAARRDFVASVSHELRTPLAQIRMFSETLLLGREDDEAERRRWLGVIAREARRLGDLVENILLFSHIDAARVRLEPEVTDLGELVEDVVEAYVPFAQSRGMRIVADAPSRIAVYADPRALRQVVVNLLDNALKYGPSGQTVTVEVERESDRARLAVSDQGPGIQPADRERIFQPFVRLRRDGGSSGGSGIGLAVVRGLVEQHGGSLRVEAAEGGGARFVMEMSLAPHDAPPPGTPAWGLPAPRRKAPASDPAPAADASQGA